MMMYSFSCPTPCDRVIRVAARDAEEAVRKIIREGGLTCRIGGNRPCKSPHPQLSPLPDGELRGTIRFMMKPDD